MNTTIRPMMAADGEAVVAMMRDFYTSPAVHTDGSDDIYRANVAACVEDNPYLEGFVFDTGDGVVGYAMLAHSFSTEFGKRCVWIEDLYVQESHRGQGLASRFFTHIEALYPHVLFRLEACRDNVHAVELYRRRGYSEMPYLEMYRL